MAQLAGMCAIAYIFISDTVGIIISVALALTIYLIVQVRIFVKNDYYLPNGWMITNLCLLIGTIMGASIAAFRIPGFNDFVGISISACLSSAALFGFAFLRILTGIGNMLSQPVFFSPWLFPVYKYLPKKNDVEPANGPVIAFIIGSLIMIGWSALASLWMSPRWIGVCLLILF